MGESQNKDRAIMLFFGLVFAAVFLIWALDRLFLPLNSRPVSPRVKSEANLRQIGLAIMQYASDNAGTFPDSFETVLMNEDINSDAFVSPLTNDIPAFGPTTRAIADQLSAGGHLSYVYLGKGLTSVTVTPDTVLAYEKFSPPSGTNVLYGDYHVEWLDSQSAALLALRLASPATQPVTLPSH